MNIKLSWNRNWGKWHIWDADKPDSATVADRKLHDVDEVRVECPCHLSNEREFGARKSWMRVSDCVIKITDQNGIKLATITKEESQQEPTT